MVVVVEMVVAEKKLKLKLKLKEEAKEAKRGDCLLEVELILEMK